MVESTAETFIRPEEFWKNLGLRANQTVVHLGSGPGFYLIPAAEIVGSKGHVIGIDVRADMLSEVESRAERSGVDQVITTLHANLEDGATSGIASDSADWTLVANILYLSDPDKILAEAARITKQTGSVVIVEWDVSATPLGPPEEDRLSKPKVLEHATKQGLKLYQEFSPSPYHFGLLLTKKT